ncbi:MAG: pilus assembly protein TadB [Ponticaulis sp.]|nr:pilus assembly protein TadB [Ponticaulis sp.]|tara:strand:+ start:10319 stop:11284 length:966 start_codon:yes stop_codon:yes gene_type:complete
MPDFFDENLPYYLMIFGSVVMAVQSTFGMLRQSGNTRKVNHRLKVSDGSKSISEVILRLRRERGLTEDGEIQSGFEYFNRLITRSGMAIKLYHLGIFAALVAAVVGGAVFYFAESILFGATAGVIVGPLVVLFFMKSKVAGRNKKLGRQLPDALEVITRSLEAGHPVPVAVALVGREMPDPIGSEFGLAADEIAYGSSLPEAIRKMAIRVQHPDIDLFAATVRVQEKTGGNLSGLLRANADTIRARQKMRLKVKAASSEGRASAMILTSAPFLVGISLHLLTPHFYGEVIGEPMIQMGLGGFFLWMVIGNLVMRQMINFKV